MFNSLPVDLSLKEGHLAVVVPITLAIVSFVIYWFTAQSEKVREKFYKRSDFDTASVHHIFFTKIFGFLTMGVIPLVLCIILLPGTSLTYYGLAYKADTLALTLVCIFILSLVVVPMASASARKPKNLLKYPQIRARVWTNKTVLINIIGWALYLFGYETLFRGVLLMPLAEHMGIWPAIAINIALYSATHIPKGLEETIGAMPLGLILCLLTLATGTIWVAFFVHLTMALMNSFTALKFHPDISYKRNSQL